MEFLSGLFFVLFVVLSACLLVQLLFFGILFARFAFYKPKKQQTNNYPPVSVIICAKNESGYIQQFLQNILTQDYPDYEVILVNDNSIDDSDGVLKEMQYYHKRLQVINVSTQLKAANDKRLALSVGIKSAKNDLVLITDADCCPNSLSWIKEMVDCQKGSNPIVLGYCSYGHKKGLFNKLISFDVFYTAICYFSFAIAGKPYMGTGKNILFSKTTFLENFNYLSAYRVNAGRNDMIISDMAEDSSIAVSYGQKSQMISFTPYESFTHWLKEKKGRQSASKYYKFVNKFFLRLYEFTGFLFYVLIVILLFPMINNLFLLIFLPSIYCLRLLCQWFVFAKSCNKLNEKKLIKYIPLFDLFFAFLMPFVRGILIFKRKDEWK
jgi:glycosyltransferase involved in cell wall biosynthesis